MKSLTISLLILLPFLANGQTRIDTLFAVADHHFQNKNYDRAQELYGNLKSVLDKGTNDYNYAADQIAMIRFFDRDALRQQGKYRESINYLMDFIRYIEEEREFIRPLWYDEKRYFLIKTIIQNYFALGELEKARIYQDMLYAAYRAKLLPEGIDEYYSFEMFRWQDKNVWGYEWYPELGDPEAEGSFSKIIYFVYSTDEAGQDKDQLFRLHVLKVHKIDNKMPDYVLTKRVETAVNEPAGTLWGFTYNRPIDYRRLKADIMAVLAGKYEPDKN